MSRRIRRQTLGMAPDELRTMYEHHDAVLHSIGEGLVVIGRGRSRDARVDIVNDEARRLLDLPDGPVPLSSIPPETMRVDDASPAKDQVHLTDKRVLVVNQHPVEWEGNRIGTVLTIRDHTELQNVLGGIGFGTQFCRVASIASPRECKSSAHDHHDGRVGPERRRSGLRH